MTKESLERALELRHQIDICDRMRKAILNGTLKVEYQSEVHKLDYPIGAPERAMLASAYTEMIEDYEAEFAKL